MEELQLKKDFVLRKMRGVNILLPSGLKVKDFGGALVLNDTGALIYEQLQSGKTAEEVATVLVTAYDVAYETALADVHETIDSLREVGVVV
ncbi:MAG: PqqD family protein [Bacteroidaceae bacterium]|nr:PqqD family protein [Bacteroidaceae bacterium]